MPIDLRRPAYQVIVTTIGVTCWMSLFNSALEAGAGLELGAEPHLVAHPENLRSQTRGNIS